MRETNAGTEEMHSILTLDEIQLRRIDQAVAAFAELSDTERARKLHLLDALQRQRNELLRYQPRARSQPKPGA